VDNVPFLDLNRVSVNMLIKAPELLVKTDAQIHSVKHIIEDLNLDAVKLVKMAVLLRTLLRQRRYYKEITALHNSMCVDSERVLNWKKKSDRRLMGYKDQSEQQLEYYEKKYNL
jgi:hypothetical protein